MSDQDYAVVVGIGGYPSFAPLGGPVNDANDFVAWLKKPANDGGGGVPEVNIQLLVSSDPPADTVDDAHPIMDEVLARFRKVKKLISTSPLRRARRLYIFMAGHGIAPTPQETVLLMANADTDTVGLHVAGFGYAEYFRLNSLAKEVVLIMDCCRDIVIGVQPNPVLWPNFIIESGGENVKIFYAFATKWSSVSREKDHQGRMRGLFTRALIEGLNNSMNVVDGRITGVALKNYIHNRIPELCAPDPPQSPDINPGTATADIVFVEGGTPTPQQVKVIIHAGDGKPARLYVRDAQFATQASHDLGMGDEWELLLPQGLYEIVTVDERPLTMFRALGTEAIHVTV